MFTEETTGINFHYEYPSGVWVDVDENGVTIRTEAAILLDASELAKNGKILNYTKQIEQ